MIAKISQTELHELLHWHSISWHFCRAWAVFTRGAWAWCPSTLLADLQCGHTPFSSTHAIIRPRHRCPSICSSPCTWKYKRRHRVPVCRGSLLWTSLLICIPINPCNANVWKWRLTTISTQWAQEKRGREETRVSPSRVPVLSFAHYFQAPVTQARACMKIKSSYAGSSFL